MENKTKETLSDKIMTLTKVVEADRLSNKKMGIGLLGNLIFDGDVKEFIKKIKEIMNCGSFTAEEIKNIIDGEAGDDLK